MYYYEARLYFSARRRAATREKVNYEICQVVSDETSCSAQRSRVQQNAVIYYTLFIMVTSPSSLSARTTTIQLIYDQPQPLYPNIYYYSIGLQ